MARPRAVDDFAVIPARMEELRRERADVRTRKRTLGGPPPLPFNDKVEIGLVGGQPP